MIEQVYEISGGDEQTITKVSEDEFVQIFRMVFHQNEGLPVHMTNAETYIAVMRGTLSITLDKQKAHEYVFGCMLRIPQNTTMKVTNRYNDVLEFLLVKYPIPVAGKDYFGK